MSRPGARQSIRYWGKSFPEWSAIAPKVLDKCEALIRQMKTPREILLHTDRFQQCLLVACQVLSAPMRGKPYWSLSIVDKKDNSMARFVSSLYQFSLPQDYLSLEGTEMKMHVRDQKTSGRTGFVCLQLEHPIKELLAFWISTIRPRLLGNARCQEDHVFMCPRSQARFTQQSFSKYMARAFLDVTGHAINLQTVRKIFSEGLRIV